MSKTVKDQEKFIELRARGLSFDKIAKEINVSKPVLIKWNTELSNKISNQIFTQAQSILEQYKLVKLDRLESLSKQLERINQEIDKRDFKDIQIKDLFGIKTSIELYLKSEIGTIIFDTEIRINHSIWDSLNNTHLLKLD